MQTYTCAEGALPVAHMYAHMYTHMNTSNTNIMSGGDAGLCIYVILDAFSGARKQVRENGSKEVS